MDGATQTVGLAVALGVGLLIGAERERRNRGRSVRAAAGVRTFAVAALLGAAAAIVGGGSLVVAVTVGVCGLALVGYLRTRRDPDPGLTSELALLLTVLTGALAPRAPELAAALGVTLAVLLAARTALHRFVETLLTPREWRDGLVLFVASVVILPHLPDRAFGPFDALNPHAIWSLVVLVLAIGALGHVATRVVGARWGLPLGGLISGFVSSIATIGALGARAKTTPALLPGAVAGAVLSTVATVLQMAAVIAVTDPPTLRALALPLSAAGVAALAFAALFMVGNLRQAEPVSADAAPAFDLGKALAFAAILSAVLLASAAVRHWFGPAGLLAAAAVSGLADGHAAAISTAALAAGGHVAPAEAVWPILAALTANTLVKAIVAATSGGAPFARRVVPGLAVVVGAAWLGAALAQVWAPPAHLGF